MTHYETIEITCRIPKPPEGWQFEPRQPNEGEEFRYLWFEQNQWTEGSTYKKEIHVKGDHLIFAFRTPPKKRLMTPQELAGKWIHDDSSAAFVVSFCNDHEVVSTAHGVPRKVSDLHVQGVLVSDTPNSPRRSLEMEE